MISKKDRTAASYVEKLLSSLKDPRHYYSDLDKKHQEGKASVNDFPQDPGVYAIIRKNPYSKHPIVLYVGKITIKRSIKSRLGDHFSSRTPNVGGSQFCKLLMQICQDESCVMKILWSKNTLIGTVGLAGESDEMISRVEKLVMLVLKPKLNVIG